jgi:predicted house-cleaning noncanonical NTP pyrophosphatase (MazG superfamily)
MNDANPHNRNNYLQAELDAEFLMGNDNDKKAQKSLKAAKRKNRALRETIEYFEKRVANLRDMLKRVTEDRDKVAEQRDDRYCEMLAFQEVANELAQRFGVTTEELRAMYHDKKAKKFAEVKE